MMWDAYHDMLDLCREKGWNAVLVTPPYPVEYSACFPDGFYESFLLQVEALSREYGVPYLDYSHEPAFTERYDLFKNIDHLNLDGAALFDGEFFDDIGALVPGAGDGAEVNFREADRLSATICGLLFSEGETVLPPLNQCTPVRCQARACYSIRFATGSTPRRR